MLPLCAELGVSAATNTTSGALHPTLPSVRADKVTHKGHLSLPIAVALTQAAASDLPSSQRVLLYSLEALLLAVGASESARDQAVERESIR